MGAPKKVVEGSIVPGQPLSHGLAILAFQQQTAHHLRFIKPGSEPDFKNAQIRALTPVCAGLNSSPSLRRAKPAELSHPLCL
jgi:hypothetical protein